MKFSEYTMNELWSAWQTVALEEDWKTNFNKYHQGLMKDCIMGNAVTDINDISEINWKKQQRYFYISTYTGKYFKNDILW